jgi:hypothetical protein
VKKEGKVYTEEGMYLYQIDKDDIQKVTLKQTINFAKEVAGEEPKKGFVVNLRDNELDVFALSEYP